MLVDPRRIRGREVLLFSQKPNSRRECAALARVESWRRMADWVDHIVDHIGIAAPADVVESATNCKMVPQQMKAFFELHIEREIKWKALRAGSADELLLRIQQAVGKSRASFQRVRQLCFVQDRQLEKRSVSPGQKTVGRVPRIRPWLLGAEHRIIHIKVESLIGSCRRMRVRPHHAIRLVKAVSQRDLKRGVAVVPRVLQQEYSVTR